MSAIIELCCYSCSLTLFLLGIRDLSVPEMAVGNLHCIPCPPPPMHIINELSFLFLAALIYSP